MSDRDQWVYTVGTDGWFNPWDGNWRLDDVCDADAWRWIPAARCRDAADPEMFFQPRPSTDRVLLKSLCEQCPVKTECLDHALTHDEEGWWGGTDRNDRRRILKDALTQAHTTTVQW